MSHFSQQLLKFGLIILLVNIVGMWAVIYLDHQKLIELQKLNNLPSKPVKAGEKNDGVVVDVPSLETRLGEVEDVQEELSERVDVLESSVSALQNNSTATVRSSVSSGSTAQKEYMVYLGEGWTLSREWTTIQPTTITLDTKKYPGMSAVYFESALSTKGGEAYAQLIESSTGAIISSPQLMNNTIDPTWKSMKVNLLPGSHSYVVQLRSSSGEQATLSGARLRIIAN